MSPLSSSGHLVQSFFTNGPPDAVVFFFCFAGLARLKVARFAMAAPMTPLITDSYLRRYSFASM